MGGKSKEDRDKEEKSARFVDVGPKPPVNVNVNVLVNETRILGAAKMRLRGYIRRARCYTSIAGHGVWVENTEDSEGHRGPNMIFPSVFL